jgi:DNA primase
MDVTTYFPQIRETAEGFSANCPRCEDKERKFYYNTEKGVGCCFHAECPWFKDRGGVTERRLVSYFSGQGVVTTTPEVIRSSKEADVKLPKEFALIADLDYEMKDTLYSYLGSRGIPKKVVQAARVGYCETGRFWGYMIFPVFDDEGEVAYWQGRRFKNRTPKFYNPKSTRKSELVYRINNARRPKTIILVESIINALTLESGIPSTHNLVLGLLGKSMSQEQRDQVLLYERWIESLVIALDGDAVRDAVEIASQFQGLVPATKIARVPDGEDINSLGREKAWDLIYQAPVYSEKHRMEFLHGE